MQWCEYLHVKKERGREGDEMKEEEGEEKRNEQSFPGVRSTTVEKQKPSQQARRTRERKKESDGYVCRNDSQ